MATQKYIELQEFSDSELLSEVEETKVQYRNLKFDHSIKGLDNPIILKEVRRDIARLNSEIRRRELAKLTEEELAKRSKIRARRKWKK